MLPAAKAQTIGHIWSEMQKHSQLEWPLEFIWLELRALGWKAGFILLAGKGIYPQSSPFQIMQSQINQKQI